MSFITIELTEEQLSKLQSIANVVSVETLARSSRNAKSVTPKCGVTDLAGDLRCYLLDFSPFADGKLI